MLYHHFGNYGCRLNINYYYKNLKIAVLENEFLRVSVLIDKGTDIFKFLYKPKDMDFMWLPTRGINSPVKFVSAVSTSEGNFTKVWFWRGLLCRSRGGLARRSLLNPLGISGSCR